MSSAQVQIVNSYFDAGYKKDLNLCASLLHRDFKRVTQPSSLNTPSRDKEEWITTLKNFWGLANDSKNTIHSIDDAPGKVTVHRTASAKLPNGEEHTSEIVSTFDIATDDDGSLKIKALSEFHDADAYRGLQDAVKALRSA